MNESLYQTIIARGKQLPPFKEKWKTLENLVTGCQSTMYLKTTVVDGKLTFAAFSDALISKGLAALLMDFYNGKSAEYILKTPPTFLEEQGIIGSLTPGRANGVASLYLKMKQAALVELTQACS